MMTAGRGPAKALAGALSKALAGALAKAIAAALIAAAFGCSSAAPPVPRSGASEARWPRIVRLTGCRDGPTLLVVAGIHGDEGSGPEAAMLLAAGPPPARGR